ncbi:hypothetical protein [Streptomyces sp. NPDC087297]|uniref:hypothetical protein n=1 Tax=Streptomyces sp. NPDC087297 TaxID=3365778 RepID=UPI00381E4EB8
MGRCVTAAEELVFDHEQVRRNGIESYEGTPLDVRTVIAAMPQHVKDEFRLDEVPWSRFGHAYGPADDIPGLLVRLRSDAEAADHALGRLWSSLVHQGTVGSAAPPWPCRSSCGSPPTRPRTTVRKRSAWPPLPPAARTGGTAPAAPSSKWPRRTRSATAPAT